MDDVVAVLRRCVRCWTWRSVDAFLNLAHVCQPCMRGTSAYRAMGHMGLTRGIVLTDQGKEAIREVQPAA